MRRGPAGAAGPERGGCGGAGLADELFLPAAGDFVLIARRSLHVLGGYHSVASTSHLDSLLLCKASGAGLRQLVLTRPCVMLHQKHPARDPSGVEARAPPVSWFPRGSRGP